MRPCIVFHHDAGVYFFVVVKSVSILGYWRKVVFYTTGPEICFINIKISILLSLLIVFVYNCKYYPANLMEKVSDVR